MITNSRSGRAAVLMRPIGLHIREHPFLTASIVLILVLIFAQMRSIEARNAAEEAYRNSPEGRVEAAREAQRSKNDATVSVAQILVESRLRDPESAQFMGTKVVRKDGEEAVCGFVNSKNGFGGMAGNEAFAVKDVIVYLANEHPTSADKVFSLCADGRDLH